MSDTGSEGSSKGDGAEGRSSLVCRDCPMWYGEEDKGWGPCSIKHQRGAVQFITFGGHSCDEGYLPAIKIPVMRKSKAHPR